MSPVPAQRRRPFFDLSCRAISRTFSTPSLFAMGNHGIGIGGENRISPTVPLQRRQQIPLFW